RTKAEVAAKLRKARADADRGLPPGDGRVTVAVHLERWLDTQRHAGKSENTIANYEWAIRKHLVPALGSRRIVELTADDVDELLIARTEAGAAKNTVMRIR